jgi:hypothetical protein
MPRVVPHPREEWLSLSRVKHEGFSLAAERETRSLLRAMHRGMGVPRLAIRAIGRRDELNGEPVRPASRRWIFDDRKTQYYTTS